MSKGLEALKEIAIQSVDTFALREPIRTNAINDLLKTKQFKCIEKELKDGARYKQALEIIKRTRLNVGKFMILCKGDHEHTPNTTYEQYIYFCEHEDDIGGDKMHSFPCYRLTKEEYELVLEVLYGKETS